MKLLAWDGLMFGDEVCREEVCIPWILSVFLL
jgi:hypothetical protein